MLVFARVGSGALSRRLSPGSIVAEVAVAIVIAVGSLAAFRLVTEDPAARKVYNLDVDASTYDSIARQLSTSWDLRAVPPSQPPGFVVFLGAIFSIAGPSYLAAKLTLWGLSVLTVGLAAVVMWRGSGPLEGLVTAALCSFSPGYWSPTRPRFSMKRSPPF